MLANGIHIMDRKISVGYGQRNHNVNLFVCNMSYLFLKAVLSGLRQFLATESPFEMMKNMFYFT